MSAVCLVLAIISAIGTGLALVGSIIMAFVFIVSYQSDANYFDSTGLTDNVLLGAPVVILASLVSFIFSVLLCNGVHNRRPGHVKAYFIYGMVVTALAAQISAAVMFNSGDPLPGIFGLLGCALHCLFLVPVYQTYLKLGRKALSEKHVRLI